MTTAAANAVAAGITIFASSGNDGYCDSMGWPACISYVNSVGAVYDANIRQSIIRVSAARPVHRQRRQQQDAKQAGMQPIIPGRTRSRHIPTAPLS